MSAGFDNAGYSNPGYNNPGYQNGGATTPPAGGTGTGSGATGGYENSGYENPGYNNAGYNNAGTGGGTGGGSSTGGGYENPGYGNPGYNNPAYESGIQPPTLENMIGPATTRFPRQTRKRGDSGPPLFDVLLDGFGRPVSIPGATVRLVLKGGIDVPTTLVDVAADNLDDGTPTHTGMVRYFLTAQQLAVAGDYNGEWKVTHNNERVTFPSEGYFQLIVASDLD